MVIFAVGYERRWYFAPFRIGTSIIVAWDGSPGPSEPFRTGPETHPTQPYSDSY